MGVQVSSESKRYCHTPSVEESAALETITIPLNVLGEEPSVEDTLSALSSKREEKRLFTEAPLGVKSSSVLAANAGVPVNTGASLTAVTID